MQAVLRLVVRKLYVKSNPQVYYTSVNNFRGVKWEKVVKEI